jgi:cytochrome c oxidase subunit 3
MSKAAEPIKAVPGSLEKASATLPYLGMIFFLISEAFLFGALFWTYYYLRAQTLIWPPAGVQLDSPLAIVNTVLLLSSSASVWWAGRQVRQGKLNGLATGLMITIGLGVAFLGITGWEWTHETFRPWTDAYGSIFYLMTGFHALHVFGGVLLMLAMLARTLRDRISVRNYLPIEVASLYWHFVDGIWIIVFITLFVVR